MLMSLWGIWNGKLSNSFLVCLQVREILEPVNQIFSLENFLPESFISMPTENCLLLDPPTLFYMKALWNGVVFSVWQKRLHCQCLQAVSIGLPIIDIYLRCLESLLELGPMDFFQHTYGKKTIIYYFGLQTCV